VRFTANFMDSVIDIFKLVCYSPSMGFVSFRLKICGSKLANQLPLIFYLKPTSSFFETILIDGYYCNLLIYLFTIIITCIGRPKHKI
jgi:hypothetical protein